MPVSIIVSAGSWFTESVCIDLMTARSSTIFAVQGSSSLTHMPAFPCWENLYSDGWIGNFDCALAMPMRSSKPPPSTESGISMSSFRSGL